jgi:DNA-binding MarR family transcriptional regulator
MSIRQKASMIRGIIAALRAIDADMERVDELAAARLGINLTDFRCLDLLSRGEPITPGQLASESGLTTGAVTALIDRLEASGYVRRARDEEDRRRVLILPTRRAAAKVWPWFRGIVETSSAVLSQFRIGELETISRFLDINRAAIRKELKRLGRAQQRAARSPVRRRVSSSPTGARRDR